jgi:hypothetical protein
MLTLKLDNQLVRPGDKVVGEIAWDFEKSITTIHLRLFWTRSGFGEPETMIAGAREIQCGSPAGRARFEFEAPFSPYSFVGTLFGIEWQIEAATNPSTELALVPLTIGPGGTSVFLRPDDAIAKLFQKRA